MPLGLSRRQVTQIIPKNRQSDRQQQDANLVLLDLRRRRLRPNTDDGDSAENLHARLVLVWDDAPSRSQTEWLCPARATTRVAPTGCHAISLTGAEHRFHTSQFCQVDVAPDSVPLRVAAARRRLLFAYRPDLAGTAGMEPAACPRVERARDCAR